jgi:3-phenylpropionate/trans-cinnamate dioxygenase ferredoxin component
MVSPGAEVAAVTWIRACAAADLADEVPLGVVLDQIAVCLVRAGGALFAVRDECTHEAVPLSEGDVQDGTIECWRHGSRFDLATGAVLSLPAVEPVAVFAVRLVAGEVLVEVSPGGYPGPWDVDEGRGGGRDAGVV